MPDIHLTADREGITEHPTAHAARSWERTMNERSTGGHAMT